MTRDNEDRITQLQNRVDDMTQEVVKQKREILEYKNKEKNSLDQIGAVSDERSSRERMLFYSYTDMLISQFVSSKHTLHALKDLKQTKSRSIYPSNAFLKRNVVSHLVV